MYSLCHTRSISLGRLFKISSGIKDIIWSRISPGDYGRVKSVGDGIAIASGLRKVGLEEIVEFSSGIKGMAFLLEHKTTGIMLFGNDRLVKEGDLVRRTKTVLSVSAGECLLGRVIDPLGNPIDGKGPLSGLCVKKNMSEKAPNLISREPIRESIHTGIKCIDTMFPIGKGQRELIIGDKHTGKTTIALDTIINQKKWIESSEKNKVYCIYVAIGQKMSEITSFVKKLEDSGSLGHSIIISSSASDPASVQYIAPYVGCSVGEYFRDTGRHSLVVYDDLSKHAMAYRQISLLLRRPPGKETYPGDIFYIHSRLLERSAKLGSKLGGGSMTALPVVETQNGDFSGYIPTNIISIADGQIALDSNLFATGTRPAVNIGLSVSRIGSSAQTKAMKQVSGSLKLSLSQYKELVNFSKLRQNTDKTTQFLINRGLKLEAMLRQKKHTAMQMEEQVVVVFSAINGYMDGLDTNQVSKFECKLLSHMRKNHKNILQLIRQEKEIRRKTERMLRRALSRFLYRFEHILKMSQNAKF